MATLEKRGQFWRVKVRRAGLPAQTKTFDNRTHAQQWARSVESDLDKGIVADRRTAQRLSLAEVLERYRREVTPTKRGSLDENLRLKAMAQRPFARIRMSALTSSLLAAYRDENAADCDEALNGYLHAFRSSHLRVVEMNAERRAGRSPELGKAASMRKLRMSRCS
jgi:hypothetical protein